MWKMEYVYLQLYVDMDNLECWWLREPKDLPSICFQYVLIFKHNPPAPIFIVNTWCIVMICNLRVHLRVPDFV